MNTQDHWEPVDIETEKSIDARLGLEMVSLRLESQTVENFRAIAERRNMPTQALMRECLNRFAGSNS